MIIKGTMKLDPFWFGDDLLRLLIFSCPFLAIKATEHGRKSCKTIRIDENGCLHRMCWTIDCTLIRKEKGLLFASNSSLQGEKKERKPVSRPHTQAAMLYEHVSSLENRRIRTLIIGTFHSSAEQKVEAIRKSLRLLVRYGVDEQKRAKRIRVKLQDNGSPTDREDASRTISVRHRNCYELNLRPDETRWNLGLIMHRSPHVLTFLRSRFEMRQTAQGLVLLNEKKISFLSST